ncbi:arylesterase [Pseudomonas abyssi]|jgi:acyl-CoA thioesterase-1|uniref:Arylesterase n=2 Tax=Pseudomonas TaxID=286 RepID=A0A2A3MHA6_9PSED|nr:arylesterase [Pseudomonadales bacterium]MAG67051.1 arylesterase [Pseudomonadales bacterium]PBK03934.1 arylesterase [Pseudomonas abyssi]|tara:strand:+ start:72260 stop:72916 length:657 start_codon:yes stop_codon:yes gene_type:complete
MVTGLMNVLRNWLGGLLLCLLSLPAAAQGILILGDSISAAFGLEISDGWVSLLERRLEAQNLPFEVHNASVSGDTTAGGLARLPALLARHEPNLVVIELGGNDGLRGLPTDKMQQNLAAMVERSRAAGAEVVLLGMRIPPNYGVRYTSAFEQVFRDVAEQQQVPLVPFVLEGVAGVPELMQADGVHPNAQGQPGILDNAWPVILDWVQSPQSADEVDN